MEKIKEIEALSEEIHRLYCDQYFKDKGEPYWTGGDYSKLDEHTKEYDRNIARLIASKTQEAIDAENKRCQTVLERVFAVLERVFDELAEQGLTLEQLQQAVFFALNADEPPAEGA